MFIAGAVLYAIGSRRVIAEKAQRESGHASAVTWPQLVDETLGDVETPVRLDMIERLSLVNTVWSRGVLERALEEERDPEIVRVLRATLSC